MAKTIRINNTDRKQLLMAIKKVTKFKAKAAGKDKLTPPKPTWVGANKEKYVIEKMTDSHLTNTYNLLLKRIDDGWMQKSNTDFLNIKNEKKRRDELKAKELLALEEEKKHKQRKWLFQQEGTINSLFESRD